MTEDEAKTKSCCGPMQSDFGKTHVVNCIGSACMAWRWYRTHINDPNDPGGDLIPSTVTYGFCGLAGHWHEGRRDD